MRTKRNKKDKANFLTPKLKGELTRRYEKFLEELSGLEGEQSGILREYRKKLETLKLKELEQKLGL